MVLTISDELHHGPGLLDPVCNTTKRAPVQQAVSIHAICLRLFDPGCTAGGRLGVPARMGACVIEVVVQRIVFLARCGDRIVKARFGFHGAGKSAFRRRRDHVSDRGGESGNAPSGDRRRRCRQHLINDRALALGARPCPDVDARLSDRRDGVHPDVEFIGRSVPMERDSLIADAVFGAGVHGHLFASSPGRWAGPSRLETRRSRDSRDSQSLASGVRGRPGPVGHPPRLERFAATVRSGGRIVCDRDPAAAGTQARA